jgi:hypothetical protein
MLCVISGDVLVDEVKRYREGENIVMRIRTLLVSSLAAVLIPAMGHEIDACRASSLIAWKEQSPSVTDVGFGY